MPKEPYRPPDQACLVNGAQWCLFHLPNRERKVVHFACGHCVTCLLWRKHLIVCRYGLIRSPTQTLLRVSGFERADDASAWSKKQSARVARHHRSNVPRWRGIDRTGDYRYSLTVVYDEALPDNLVKLTDRAAKRAGLECEMTVRSVTTDDFRALVPLQSAIYNALQGDETSGRTNTSHFSHWPNWEQDDADYMLDDGIRQEGVGHVPEATPPSRWEKKRNKMELEERAVANVRDWLEGIELSHSGLMTLRAVRRAGKPGSAWGLHRVGRLGRGPTKLLRDLADALDDDGDVGFEARGVHPGCVGAHRGGHDAALHPTRQPVCECAECVQALADLLAMFAAPPPAWDGPQTKYRSVAPTPGEYQPRLLEGGNA